MKAILVFVVVLLFFPTGARAQTYPQYHDIADQAKAETEAKARHLPLAWVGGYRADFGKVLPERGSQAQLTQMALADLQDQAVVIFFEAINMAPVPLRINEQFRLLDDGPLSDGATWNPPKIVFTDPQATHVLGRVSRTQMTEDSEMAINQVLQKISQDPIALKPDASRAPSVAVVSPPEIPAVDANSTPPTSPSPDSSAPADIVNAPDSAPVAVAAEPEEINAAGLDNEDLDISPEERSFWAWLRKDGVYAGFGLMILLVCLSALSRNESK